MVLALILPFSSTRPDSSILRYSPEFYHFLALAWILPFFDTNLDLTFPGTCLDPSSVLVRILHFSGTRLDSTILWYSSRFYPSPVLTWILPFSVLARTLFLYSPRFYPSPVVVRILPFSGTDLDSTFLSTRPDPFSVLARILPFSSTRLDSTLLR